MANSNVTSQDATRTANRVYTQGKEMADNVRSDLRDFGQKAREVGGEQFSRLQETGAEQVERTIEFVRRRPLSALAIATGVGFALACMMREK